MSYAGLSTVFPQAVHQLGSESGECAITSLWLLSLFLSLKSYAGMHSSTVVLDGSAVTADISTMVKYAAHPGYIAARMRIAIAELYSL